MKRIGITQRVVLEQRVNERRDTLDQQWHAFAEEAGMQLIPIPNSLSHPNEYARQLQLEGLIFSGGNNVSESDLEDQESIVKNDIAVERDKTEKSLLEWAIKEQNPVIGVCRGMQFIYTFFGGKLKEINSKTHVAREHDISFTDKQFSEHYGNINKCNSYHRKGMSVKDVPSGLKVSGIYEDENEAFKHQNLPVVGMMWHPERYPEFRNSDIQFFQNVLKSKRIQ